ncbi:hypothetical protein AV530_006177 [Patagioenas fasciata monilis]|uniref:Uncharacterized protein n=1 Tax=Patagioenas fasciata monilis TaxID=372326 RepID=A0A1V4J8D4_PATFA|nr:hypothetical protein AV530_006177 [Patagioenas fasciata monilis]
MLKDAVGPLGERHKSRKTGVRGEKDEKETLWCLPKAATQSAATCPGRSEELASQDTDKDNRGWTEEDQRCLCRLIRGIHVNKQAPQTFLHVTADRDTLKICAKSQNDKASPFEGLLKSIYKDC